MKAAVRRGLWAPALFAACLIASGQEAPRARRPGPEARLVGTWQNVQGSRIKYLADGTGENPDDSRFRWKLEGDDLVGAALGRDGKPTGEPQRIPISFTADGKEYTITLGKMEVTFFRLEPDGRVAEGRTPEGRRYLSGLKAKAEAKKLRDEAHEFSPRPAFRDPPLPRTIGAPGVAVGPNVRVSASRPDISHWEVILAADPEDPERLLAGSMCNPPPIDYGASKMVVYASTDGGKTWAPTLDRRGRPTDVFADPTLAFGPDGSAFFAELAGPAPGEGWVEVFRSVDGGRTWGRPTTIEGFRDRPFLEVDRGDGPFGGRLYVNTADGLYASSDSGKTFAAPTSWTRRPGYISLGTGNPVALSDGSVVVLYNGVRRDKAKPSAPAAQGAYLAVRRSTDGGASFSDERLVALGDSGVPIVIAADAGPGRTRDHLYVVWPEFSPTRGARVRFARSADRGETWSKPMTLSEQGDGAGDEGAGEVAHESYLPSVAVNRRGVVGVCWYDTRGLPVSQAGYNVRFRASADGGATWSPSLRVSDASTLWTAQVKRRHDRPEEERGLWKHPGHTAGLAADARGAFHPLWIDGRTGVRQVVTATVTVESKP